MAQLQRRLPDNVPGDFYVDSTCIDCDTCRQVAPATFSASQDHSFVSRQPATEAERLRAAMALVACPTASIGTVSHTAAGVAADAFPEPIAKDVPDILYCGYTAESSFGASSYLIRRPGGNVLVDSPRASRRLFNRLEALGGVATLFLTHRDDVADHRRIHDRFGATRVLHADDVTRDTAGVECKPTGSEPIALADDLLANAKRLHASRSVSWYSWEEQVQSVAALLDHRFSWVLPGHGRRYRAPSAEAMRAELEKLLDALNFRVG
jgi:glyoxylase-like metal-dependent hydrolase (beta-lactamase superfamily II)/ferredoxin